MIRDLQGHVLILKSPSLTALLGTAVSEHLIPFSVSDEGEIYHLAHPLSIAERLRYKWLYARKAAEDKAKETPEPEGDGPMLA